MNDTVDGRIQELTETLQDIKAECQKAINHIEFDSEAFTKGRLDAILYLCNAALVEE